MFLSVPFSHMKADSIDRVNIKKISNFTPLQTNVQIFIGATFCANDGVPGLKPGLLCGQLCLHKMGCNDHHSRSTTSYILRGLNLLIFKVSPPPHFSAHCTSVTQEMSQVSKRLVFWGMHP